MVLLLRPDYMGCVVPMAPSEYIVTVDFCGAQSSRGELPEAKGGRRCRSFLVRIKDTRNWVDDVDVRGRTAGTRRI